MILCRVLYEGRRMEKCILLARHGVQSRYRRNLLSSRTSRTSIVESYEWTQALSSRTGCTSGHKRCRVDKEYCRVEKCISLGR